MKTPPRRWLVPGFLLLVATCAAALSFFVKLASEVAEGETHGVFAASGLGLLANALLKSLFNRPRPDLIPHGLYVADTSFVIGLVTMSTQGSSQAPRGLGQHRHLMRRNTWH